MEVGASKEELSAFQAKVTKERKAMEEEFYASSDVIFNYGYDYCAFAHNICGSEPVIPVWMPDMMKSLPPEFFINPRCPQVLPSTFLLSQLLGRNPRPRVLQPLVME